MAQDVAEQTPEGQQQSYDVHVFVVVRSKVVGVRATSRESAADLAADDAIKAVERQLGRSESVEVADGEPPVMFLVDVVGDADYQESRWLCRDGRTPLVGHCQSCCRQLEDARQLGAGE